MIEVSSWPTDLSTWNPREEPYYLEFFGEAAPRLDEACAEVLPAGGDAPKASADAPVYEYWWTLGHPGAASSREDWSDEMSPQGDDEPWRDWQDPAARVYTYFPINAGWRVKEIVATLEYLSPTAEQHVWWQDIAKDFQAIQPLLGDASSIASLVPGGSTASKWLDTVAKLQVSSVPQTQFKWSVAKVTFGSARGVMQGVMWTLPRDLLQVLGGRLTGGLALTFIPAQSQTPQTVPSVPQPADALAHAVVYTTQGKYWLPNDKPNGQGFIHLRLHPTTQAAAG